MFACIVYVLYAVEIVLTFYWFSCNTDFVNTPFFLNRLVPIILLLKTNAWVKFQNDFFGHFRKISKQWDCIFIFIQNLEKAKLIYFHIFFGKLVRVFLGIGSRFLYRIFLFSVIGLDVRVFDNFYTGDISHRSWFCVILVQARVSYVVFLGTNCNSDVSLSKIVSESYR